jgi:hypothetical protein
MFQNGVEIVFHRQPTKMEGSWARYPNPARARLNMGNPDTSVLSIMIRPASGRNSPTVM